MEESSASLSSACSMNVTQNPFDTDSLDSLHLPQCSPSVFAIKQRSTPASGVKKTPKFRWSIDQMAILHPVEIEELPYQQEDSKLDEETEGKIQAAIDKFFSQQQIIPSPWSEPKPLPRIAMSPAPPSGAGKSATKDVIPQPKPKPKTANATCQTMLTLPMDFDLEALLGSECFQYKEDNKTDTEIMSTSSLRRKLFSGDSTPPVSPIKSGDCRTSPSRESMPFIISSPALSPIRAVEEVKSVSTPGQSLMKTPGSAQSQFSSSPIGSSVTPTSRLSSSGHTELESPCMSPIGSGNTTTPLSSTATSEPPSYTKSNLTCASLPDDSSISMSIMESSSQQSSINITRNDLGSKSCASPFHHTNRDKTYEESLDTWSNDLYNYASQKLTSTMNPEPLDSLGLTFEPRMCSSRLIMSAIQESKCIAGNSESGLSANSKAATDDDVGFGLFKGGPDSRNSSDAIDEYRKDYIGAHQRAPPPRLPFGQQQQQKAALMDADSDSGFNTGNVSAFEPTDMEVVEGR